MTRTGAAARPPVDIEERAHSLLDWAQTNIRPILIGLAIVVAAAVGIWLYLATQANKEQRAASELARASGAVAAGNFALAETDLSRVVQQYGGTDAGKQAVLLLSEALYGQGKYQEGIDALERHADRAPVYLRTAFLSQMAAGYEDLGNFAEAAQTYLRAAQAARFDTERSVLRADAARAHTLAGNVAAARQIWETEASNDASPVAGEARVRLGELNAQAARPAPEQ
ncbi:MAG TPA: tetratricopeptide repeat protein [Gemmatimonadaceae bacterium]|nr:tetratricopeptide repeat protein [Gemmatimonadaceae bacterium]